MGAGTPQQRAREKPEFDEPGHDPLQVSWDGTPVLDAHSSSFINSSAYITLPP